MTHLKPGRELDALIAEKVMGWIKQDNASNIDDWRTPEAETFKDRLGGAAAFLPKRRSFYCEEYMRGRCDFQPSSDIAAGWEVVEKLTNGGRKSFKLNRCCYYGPGHECGHEQEQNYIAYFSHGISQTAKTAPHAICLAALKAVGYNAS